MVRKLLWFRGRRPRLSRASALQQEIQFWRDWFVSGGLQWPEDFRQRFEPGLPIQRHIATYIDQLNTPCVQILDVGSGPLTRLGRKHPTKQLAITATDLQAHEYDRLLAELGIEPPIRTIYADAERLLEQFGPDAFDIVHGENCIDHTAHPLRAIEQMVAVCKPRGLVILYHAENEGQREQYHQLHQWDFTCEDGAFVIRDRRRRATNVTKRLAACCEVECRRDGGADGYDGDAILTVIRKRVDRTWRSPDDNSTPFRAAGSPTVISPAQ